MSSELLQVEMGKREIGKGGEAFIPPSHRKSRYSSKTQNLRENPGNFGKSGDSGYNPGTPASQGQHPRN
jgi:hypothetical protein